MKQSGEVSRVGHVSLRGDAMMRRLLCEAAQSMKTRVAKWCWLKAWAMNIAKRHGSKRPKWHWPAVSLSSCIACGWMAPSFAGRGRKMPQPQRHDSQP